ncbi:PEP-CTERM sorting domain-containing protein [Aliiglaciecola sp. 3_MG-2023]|uniref:PEP-CTERM sorting domain-containing protein n=1 Tax=Aliiglaciecola sp. 3_MG-2023 TaxID=3062644 RepID=UPI0026E344DE|nr:PEP-CTERM sorting domain-containing protein [Aliiglaciecola sp. 3_MG-2023]MDO6695451.1 PEP-CTERM sorting domain-containing protein [Aliiglaciecola sp. 3_MG-2023]
MKRILTPMLAALVLLCSASASASIISLPSSGLLSDSVVGDSGWLNEDTFGDGIDFITFDVAAQSTFSATTASFITMGLSLYQGTVANDFAIPFSNSGDFSDLFSFLVYVDGNSPYVPGLGGSLTGLVLEAGSYTLAVGGNEGFFDTFTDYAYNLDVAIAEVQQVPEPSALFLLFFGIAGLLAARKQQTK